MRISKIDIREQNRPNKKYDDAQNVANKIIKRFTDPSHQKFTCDSMHDTIWLYGIISYCFNTCNRVELYGSMYTKILTHNEF